MAFLCRSLWVDRVKLTVLVGISSGVRLNFNVNRADSPQDDHHFGVQSEHAAFCDALDHVAQLVRPCDLIDSVRIFHSMCV